MTNSLMFETAHDQTAARHDMNGPGPVNIYVASSWRNQEQPAVVQALRNSGFDVYDFKNPEPGNQGFHWSEIDPEWQAWTPESFIEKLEHPIAQDGFQLDMDALDACDICVLVMPSGRSAHLEAGYAAGAGKLVVVLLTDSEPELMYLMCDILATSISEVVSYCECYRDTPALDLDCIA